MQPRGTHWSRMCLVGGCGRRVTRYGVLCRKHSHHKTRHGNPEQRPITRTRIKPVQLWCARFLDDHGQQGGWQAMRASWRDLVDSVRADLAAQEERGVCNRHVRTGLKELVRVAESAPEDEVITLLLAFGVLFHTEPSLFKDHSAFMCEVAWRYRALSTATKKVYRLPDGTTRRVIKDIALGAQLALGRRLAENYALFGVHMATAWEERVERRRQIKQAAIDAVTSRDANGPHERTMETTA